MAHVFKAYQASLDRFVAIKVLSPSLADQPGFTERFQREAHSVARLLHPNILQVYDFGVEDGYNFIVMRYVENSRTLHQAIEEGATLDELLDYILQVADALNYAHQHGVIHRDVKPSNILIDGRWALLSDFGLVKMAGSGSYLTSTGVSIGTPAYMSPEQASGSKVDHRTDIYALGVILHKILTGTIPHDATTPLAILVKRSVEPVTPPHQLNPNIPESLEHVILHSLATKPDDRYSTATDFAEALKTAKADPNYREPAILESLRDTTIASSPKTPAGAEEKKRGLMLAGGAIAAVLFIGAILLFLLFRPDGSDRVTVQPAGQLETPAAGLPSAAAATDTPAASPTLARGTPIAVANTRLEVRSGPGDQYDLLGYLPAGATAEIVSQDEAGGWWQVRISLAGGGMGWIKADPTSSSATNAEYVPIALAPPTPTPTATVTDTPEPPTDTPIPVPTDTPTKTPPLPTDTLTPPPTTTPTGTPEPPTATAAPTGTPTWTPAPPVERPSPTRASTADLLAQAATDTPEPADTATATPTDTLVPPTATATDTPVPPTNTSTPLPPTDTPAPTATSTDRQTNTPTSAPPTGTPTPTNTPTDTPEPPTVTSTPTDTPVPPTATATPRSPTDTPAPTDTPEPPTVTSTPTDTPVPPTPRPTNTATAPRTPSAVANTRLEVRGGPGDQYDLLGFLPEGATVEILSRDETGEWWQIKTSLAGVGIAWITADPAFTTATDAQFVPIALAPPTPTATPTATNTPTDTPTATTTPEPPTHTPTPENTPTDTPTATLELATDTPTPANTPTDTPEPPTDTPEPTHTPTDAPETTGTPTDSPTATNTPTDTPEPPTATAIAMPTDTATPEPIDTPEPTHTPTDTPEPTGTPTDTPMPEPTEIPTPAVTDTPTSTPPAEPPAPEQPVLSGKLAFPVDDGFGKYDVVIVSMPGGEFLARINGAHQPDFRVDGLKLLVNGQGGGFGEDVFEADAASGNVDRPVSGSPTDSHPVYNPDGNRVAYDNPQLAIGSDGSYHPYIFVQCGIIPPVQEQEQTCQDVPRFGILVPAGQVGEIQGSNPVWTATDQIVYKGCNTWAGGGSCGVFSVGSWANKRNSNGETPHKIADGTSLIPTDTGANRVTFHARESGDWEAFVMGLDGSGLTNLSNSPNSSDGLPTLSPDGQWVAFASDRDGSWAVYVVPSAGGAATRLFDFPKGNPWGMGGDRDWTNERMSWGP